MNRFFGMVVMLLVLVGLLVGFGALAYLSAGALGVGLNNAVHFFTGETGIDPVLVYYGSSISNVVFLMLVAMMISGSLLTVAERKWSALLQNRIGANRIKVFGSALGGIPFLVADALKMLTKERVEPQGLTRILYELGPILAFAPVFALFAIIPVGPALPLASLWGGAQGAIDVPLQVASIDAGLIYLFALASLQVYGTSLAGWSSNNKLALLGGVRASSQMISYEVSLGLALVGSMIAFRTLRLDEMAVAQAVPVIGGIPAWGILLQPVGFLIFFASAFAETKRAPFDLPEGESEIVGYFIEYSGMKFGLMFLAEFVEIVVLSATVTAVFLGGWHPFVSPDWLRAQVSPLWFGAICAGAFLVKMIVMMWLQITIRWLLPRFRYDQIQKLCWKILLPAALVNVFVTAAIALLSYDGTPALDPEDLRPLAWLGFGTIVVIAIVTAAVGHRPETAARGHGHGAHGAKDDHGHAPAAAAGGH
ncbi:MAG: NADH-quinone oxidoreductase subunit H [Anaeromyxobacteraceae bacterium]